MIARLLEIVLPIGGYAVQMVEAYFDESGSHEGSPVLCVAGYIVEKDACVRLDAEWERVLNKFGLPFFRMSACAHGTYPFKRLSMDERIAVEKELIAIIKANLTYGIAVTVQPEMYDAIMPSAPDLAIGDSAYTFCARTCLTAVKVWARDQKYAGDIAYFFESGHRSQSHANALMNEVFANSGLRKEYRYVSHTFADKQKVRPLQAADIIAWQWHTDHKRRMSGKADRPRLDCRELMLDNDPESSRYHTLHWTEGMLRDMAQRVLRRKYPLTYPETA
jgi:hypothetical protein